MCDKKRHICDTNLRYQLLANAKICIKLMTRELVNVKFDRRNRLKNGKKGDVELEIYLTRECRKFIRITSVTKAEWATYQHSKEFLAEKLRIEGICRAMIVLNEELTVENLNRHLGIEPKKEKVEMSEEEFERHKLIASKTSFLDFFEMEYKKHEYAASTLRRKKVMIDALKEFGKIKRFEDLTVNNIKKFDEWLDNGRERTTVTNYHKQVHMYILRAKKQKFITEDPYESCEFEKGKNKKRVPLSENELLKLINHKFEGNVEIVRDLFIFSAYTGLAYSDVMNFKYSKMTVQIHGQDFIDGSRVKTGSDFFTPILPLDSKW